VSSTLSGVDEHLVEKVTVAATDVLAGNEFELDAEDVDVSGIGGKLRTRQGDVKIEATTPGLPGRRGLLDVLGASELIALLGKDDGVITPPAKGALGDAECCTELTAVDGGMVLLQAQPGADDQGSDLSAAQRYGKQDRGRHAE